MRSTVKYSYSFRVCQVSPTQSIRAQRTLSRHSDRGSASKHPNNYSGSHMISRWFSLQAHHCVAHADKRNPPLGKMCTAYFALAFHLPVEAFLPDDSFYFIWVVFKNAASVTERSICKCTVCPTSGIYCTSRWMTMRGSKNCCLFKT